MPHLSGPTHQRRPQPRGLGWWRRYHCWCGLRRCPDLLERERERVRREMVEDWDLRQI